jgi:GT2 family glycosyltransferase
MKKIPVIIPFFKNHDALNKAKQFLDLQTVPTEVFIRDNSIDNILYTKAINEGLRLFCFNNSNDYVLIINQDAYLSSNCLEMLVKTLEDNPTCGIVTPVAFDTNGKNTWYGGLDAFPYGRHRILSENEEIALEPFQTPWANGACFLLRTAMVRDIGVFDENMKFICSDADYSFTARSRGWDILVCPTAKIEHSFSSSASAQYDLLNKIKIADQIYFAGKWLSGDIYKKLAYEGSKLTRLLVADELRKSRTHLISLQ